MMDYGNIMNSKNKLIFKVIQKIKKGINKNAQLPDNIYVIVINKINLLFSLHT